MHTHLFPAGSCQVGVMTGGRVNVTKVEPYTAEQDLVTFDILPATCEFCSIVIDTENDEAHSMDYGTVCDGCYANMEICDGCQERFLPDDLTYVAGKHLCRTCEVEREHRISWQREQAEEAKREYLREVGVL